MKTLLGIMAGLALSINTVAASPFEGAWCLTSPSGGAVWLNVEDNPGGLSGVLMWEVGGVDPVQSIREEGEELVITRFHQKWTMTSKGMRRERVGTDTLRATTNDNQMSMLLDRQRVDGTMLPTQRMHGTRSKPMPGRPDLSTLQFGDPIELFDGESLDGWRLVNPEDNNAWSANDGILTNTPTLENGENPKQFGNLRTDREFEDFRLQLDLRLPPNGNSGIYLRGRYEVQVNDSYGRPSGRMGIGGIYGRIIPSENAAGPPGEWQTFDIILADRHVTVRLNGKLVIDNQPVEGCTGGAISSDDEKPGPIYFQGDHTAVEYRNIVLHPRVR